MGCTGYLAKYQHLHRLHHPAQDVHPARVAAHLQPAGDPRHGVLGVPSADLAQHRLLLCHPRARQHGLHALRVLVEQADPGRVLQQPRHQHGLHEPLVVHLQPHRRRPDPPHPAAGHLEAADKEPQAQGRRGARVHHRHPRHRGRRPACLRRLAPGPLADFTYSYSWVLCTAASEATCAILVIASPAMPKAFSVAGLPHALSTLRLPLL